ncbi:MerR family transcriptional regulator [Methylomonas paludis]|uniref:MerR family transcriptional regulator n=1 Tax=Methylomonas paludis TaxID=1173101 RepID=A0A975MPD2_9GAMM|nr:B12-binding domain-containing protein [Methylomonas paludis]QWF71339.1 MerR family transcriptional regulator [Methylomonas paludis]
MYSIKAIASLTGLGPETLRAWERRYRIIVPQRDENAHRFYSQLDLEKLLLLADLTRQGHAISKLSGLSVEELQKLSLPATVVTDHTLAFTEQIVQALQDYRIDRCEQLLKRALLASEPLVYLRDILSPTLTSVGELWHEGKINVAQEHMFSACVKRILLGMVNNIRSISANRPGILFATPSGDRHEFGILMCCLLAAEQHYNCYYLGPSVPAADMLDAARKLKVDIIVLSLIKTPPEPETEAALNAVVTAAKAEKFNIWLGGHGVEYWQGQYPDLARYCEMIANIDGFYSKAVRWRVGVRE